jgi:hypothetical protein
MRPAIDKRKHGSRAGYVLQIDQLFADLNTQGKGCSLELHVQKRMGCDESSWFSIITDHPAFTAKELRHFEALRGLVDKLGCEGELDEDASNRRFRRWLKVECDETSSRSSSSELFLAGSAAWSPPISFLEHLSRRFPEFDFFLGVTTASHYYEEWTCTNGVLCLVEQRVETMMQGAVVETCYVQDGTVLRGPDRFDDREEPWREPGHDVLMPLLDPFEFLMVDDWKDETVEFADRLEPEDED